MNLKLLVRLNAVLLPAFVLVFALIAVVVRDGLQRTARAQALQTARLLMASASAVRDYTVDQVKPMIETKYNFSPLTVSSFAANQTLAIVHKHFPEYHYREATLNPTNPTDRAEDWEADIVRHFREEPTQAEFVGDRQAITGTSVVIAQPIRIVNSACLDCHSTKERAPNEMNVIYPGAGGFGWQLNEIVGAQIVTVPASLVQEAGPASAFLGWIIAGGLLLLVVVNLAVILLLPHSRLGAASSTTA